MTWSETGNQYCKYEMGRANGNLRSPEEYGDEWLNEKIDVYSFGNVLYGLLTGRDPYYSDGLDVYDIRKLSPLGIVPHVEIDIRGNSFSEATIASIMDKCYEFNPDQRIDIFTVTSLLRSAVSLNNRLEMIQVTPPTTVQDYIEDLQFHEFDEKLDDASSTSEHDSNTNDDWSAYSEKGSYIDGDDWGGNDDDSDTDHDSEL